MGNTQRLRKEIAYLRELEKRHKALMRLKANSDFRLLFLDGLLKDELTRVVLERHNASPEQLAKLSKEADAISYLNDYINRVEQGGEISHHRITEALKLLDELGEDE